MYKFFVIILLILILLSTCMGCAFMVAKETAKVINIIKPEGEKEMTEEEKKNNIIACIKVQPECVLDE